MIDSINIGLTGLLAFSKDLSVIGDNVANINTPGFKGSKLLFAELLSQRQVGDGATQDSSLELGAGVGTLATQRTFTAGELRATGNGLDVAIDGNGFFVVRKDAETFYTRAGQFSFNEDGFLVDPTGARVAALDDGGLKDISLNGLRTTAGKATSRINFTGILNTNDAVTAPHDVANVPVTDSAGGSESLRVRFINNRAVEAGRWTVEVFDATGTSLTTGDIRFGGDGRPLAGFNSVTFSFAPGGVAASPVELHFGDPGSSSGVQALSTSASAVQFGSQDGFPVGSLISSTFDEDGVLRITYSNGQTLGFDRLALASFSFLQGLELVEGGLFRSGGETDRVLGHAGEDVFGSIAAGRIELANVDLAREFSNLIISQRGYQASSQVISTANEMIQQLFDIRSNR
jgi:flagellar hook protein FlgE